MVCTINGDTFFVDKEDMDQILSALLTSKTCWLWKKRKPCINVWQVDGSEWVHTLWPANAFPKTGASLFSLMCEFLQGSKIPSDHQNNIVAKFCEGIIIIGCWIKTHDGWVARVEFLCEIGEERAQSATALHKEGITDLHIEFGHPSSPVPMPPLRTFI